jgi:hypothetical protein
MRSHTHSAHIILLDWDLQLRLYPFFSNIAHGLASEAPTMAIPLHLKEFLEGFNGSIAYYDAGSDESNKWTLLMMACKSTSHIHSIVIKVSLNLFLT